VGGRRCPAEKGELLRRDEDDDDGRDDITGGSRGSFLRASSGGALLPTEGRGGRWGASASGREGIGRSEASHGLLQKSRAGTASLDFKATTAQRTGGGRRHCASCCCRRGRRGRLTEVGTRLAATWRAVFTLMSGPLVLQDPRYKRGGGAR
jgi:hypothetical protein